MSPRQFFHYVSYLQYPILLAATYFYIPFIRGMANREWLSDSLENTLVLMGLALSMSSLQDTTKTQNKLSRKIWESPKGGRIFLIYMSLLTFTFIFAGIGFMFLPEDNRLNEISVGITVLGVGVLGLLKPAIEMYENHRKDKNPK